MPKKSFITADGRQVEFTSGKSRGKAARARARAARQDADIDAAYLREEFMGGPAPRHRRRKNPGASMFGSFVFRKGKTLPCPARCGRPGSVLRVKGHTGLYMVTRCGLKPVRET
jgi:hypothetical protein